MPLFWRTIDGQLIGRVIFQTAARGCVVKGQLVYLREFVVANSGEKDGWFSFKYAEGALANFSPELERSENRFHKKY
jgi:hypothetical protein